MSTVFIAACALFIGGMIFLWQTQQEIERAPVRQAVMQNTDAVIQTQKNSSQLFAAIVPHHEVASALATKALSALAQEEPSAVVILSPDHWGMNTTLFATTRDNVLQNFSVSSDVRDDLFASAGDLLSMRNLENEHGIMNVLDMMTMFPAKTSIIPIAVSPAAREEESDVFATMLDNALPNNAVVIASVDFSHYLPAAAADFHDAFTMQKLLAGDIDALRKAEVDCAMCLRIVTEFARRSAAEHVEILEHSNSAELTDTVATANETTSYVTALFREGAPVSPKPQTTILAVGDIMLGRHVETLMRQRGADYPFEKTDQLFRGVDMVLGNLEGPIAQTHAQTPNNSLKFNFDSSVAKLLREHFVTHLSLANNHGFDQGESSYNFTRDVLRDEGIVPFGSPAAVDDTSFSIDANTKPPIVFLGIHATHIASARAAALAKVDELAAAEAEGVLIVSIHWGTEYSLTSNRDQQQFAHELIDEGADLIIGHHPHVVQEIEEYNNRLIFYSLGNFIFDQYFSNETQEMLAVGFEIQPHHIKASLFPLQSHESQPWLSSQQDANAWLRELAARSKNLANEIPSGIIEIDF